MIWSCDMVYYMQGELASASFTTPHALKSWLLEARHSTLALPIGGKFPSTGGGGGGVVLIGRKRNFDARQLNPRMTFIPHLNSITENWRSLQRVILHSLSKIAKW